MSVQDEMRATLIRFGKSPEEADQFVAEQVAATAKVLQQIRAQVLAKAAAVQLAYARENWLSTPADSISTAGKKDRKFGVAETLVSLIGATPVLRPRFIRVLPHDRGFLVRWQIGEESKDSLKSTQTEADAFAAELWDLAGSGTAGKDTGNGTQPRVGESTRAAEHIDWCASHDSDGVTFGRYTNRDAAMDHVYHLLAAEESTTPGQIQTRVIWRADAPDEDVESAWECWLFGPDREDDQPTGYVVSPVTVATTYQPQQGAEGEVLHG